MNENIKQALKAYSMIVPHNGAEKRRYSGVPIYDFASLVYLWATSFPLSSGREIIEGEMLKLVAKTPNLLTLISYEEKTIIGSKPNKIVADQVLLLVSKISDFFLLDFYDSHSNPSSWSNKIIRQRKKAIINKTSDLITLIAYWQSQHNDLEIRNLVQTRIEQELSLIEKDNISDNFLAAIQFIIEEDLILLFQKKIKKLLKK